MIITRDEFIPNYLKIIERRLYEKLRQEGFTDEMVEEADKIVYENSRHILDAIRNP